MELEKEIGKEMAKAFRFRPALIAAALTGLVGLAVSTPANAQTPLTTPAPVPATTAAGATPATTTPAPMPAPALESRTFIESNCGDPRVLCLRLGGAMVPGEQAEAYRVGQHIRVVVIDVPDDKAKVAIETRGVRSANTLLPRASGDGQKAFETAASPAVARLAERLIEIPEVDELVVYIQWTRGEVSSVGSATLEIDEPRYFARAGLSFAWVDRGARTITMEHTIVESTEYFPAVALTFWPWGHRARKLSAFESWSGGRALGDLIGFQVGTDLDFSTPFDRAFFGVVIEPISGLGLGGGLAVTTGSYFSGAPAGSAMDVVDRHMWRPYFSLNLTTELFDTLRDMAKRDEPEEQAEPPGG